MPPTRPHPILVALRLVRYDQGLSKQPARDRGPASRGVVVTVWDLASILIEPERYVARIDRRTKEIIIRPISDAQKDLRARTVSAIPKD